MHFPLINRLLLRCKCATLPPKLDRDNVSLNASNRREREEGHVKMVSGEVTPATKVTRKAIVGSTEVSDSDHNRRAAQQAPPDVIHATDLVARTAGFSLVEQSTAHSGAHLPKPRLYYISITTSSTSRINQPKKQSTHVQHTLTIYHHHHHIIRAMVGKKECCSCSSSSSSTSSVPVRMEAAVSLE